MNDVNSLRQCLPVAIECIERNTQDKVKEVKLFNSDRHIFIVTARGLKYWLLFKREFFLSFGKIFNRKGSGESINEDWVVNAMNKGIDSFIFVYQKGHVYIVPPKEFRDYAEKNNTIRVTIGGEKTYSIPVKLLRRWK